MPELTPRLGIKKPLGNETVSRAAFNENWDIIDANVVADKGSTPSIQAGPDASKPAPGTAGRLYVATDTQIIYRDTGTAWAKVGVVKWGDIEGKPTSFPPSAHTHAGSDITSKVASASAADAVPWSGVTGKPSSFTPSAHKSTHATGGADQLTPANIGAVQNAGGTPAILTSTTLPAAGVQGRLCVFPSPGAIYRDDGTSWRLVGTTTWDLLTNKPSAFPPSAHKSTHATGGTDALAPGDIGAAAQTDLAAHLADTAIHQTAEQVRKASDKSLIVEVNSSAPSSPVNGQIWYDSLNHKFKGYANGAWV